MKDNSRPVGQLALHRQFALEVPPPSQQSFSWARRGGLRELQGPRVTEYFPSHSAPASDGWQEHLLRSQA